MMGTKYSMEMEIDQLTNDEWNGGRVVAKTTFENTCS